MVKCRVHVGLLGSVVALSAAGWSARAEAARVAGTVAFTADFANYGTAPYAGATWSSDGSFVLLDGLVKRVSSGATATVIGRLPAEACPGTRVLLLANHHSGAARINVDPDASGCTLSWVAGTGTPGWVALAGLAYPVKTPAVALSALPLATGVTAYGSGWGAPRYWKSGNLVRLAGVVRRTGTGPGLLGTLPVGARPAEYHSFAQGDDEHAAAVTVRPDGTITVEASTGHDWVSLDGITFDVRSHGLGHTIVNEELVLHGLAAASASGAVLYTLPTGTVTGRHVFAARHGTGTSRVDIDGDKVTFQVAGPDAGGMISLDNLRLRVPGKADYVLTVPATAGTSTQQCVGAGVTKACVTAVWSGSGATLSSTGDNTVQTPAGPWTFYESSFTLHVDASDPLKSYFEGKGSYGLPQWGPLERADSIATLPSAGMIIGAGRSFRSRGISTIEVGERDMTLQDDRLYFSGSVTGSAGFELPGGTNGGIGVGGGQVFAEFPQPPAGSLVVPGPSYYMGGDILGVLTLGMVPSASLGVFLGSRVEQTSSRGFRTVFESDARETRDVKVWLESTGAVSIGIPALKIVSLDVTAKRYVDLDTDGDGKDAYYPGEGDDFAVLVDGTLGIGLGVVGAGLSLPTNVGSALYEGKGKKLSVAVLNHGVNPLKEMLGSDLLTIQPGMETAIDGHFTPTSWLLEFGYQNTSVFGLSATRTTITLNGVGTEMPSFKVKAGMRLFALNVDMEGMVYSKSSWKLSGDANVSALTPFKNFTFASAHAELTPSEGLILSGTTEPILGAAIRFSGRYKSDTDYSLTGVVDSGELKIGGIPLGDAIFTIDPSGASVEATATLFGSGVRLSGSFNKDAYDLTGTGSIRAGGVDLWNATVNLQKAKGATVASGATVTSSASLSGFTFNLRGTYRSDDDFSFSEQVAVGGSQTVSVLGQSLTAAVEGNMTATVSAASAGVRVSGTAVVSYQTTLGSGSLASVSVSQAVNSDGTVGFTRDVGKVLGFEFGTVAFKVPVRAPRPNYFPGLLPGRRVALYNRANGRFLRVNAGGSVDSWAAPSSALTAANRDLILLVVDAGDGTVGLYSELANRLVRLSTSSDLEALAQGTWLGQGYYPECFRPHDAGNLEIALHSKYMNRFLRITNTGDAEALGGPASSLPANWTWERFKVITLPERRDVVSTIEPTAGYWGDWHPTVNCPAGTWVTGFDQMVEVKGSSSDETALNAVRLYCSNGVAGSPVTQILSHPGRWGSWGSTPARCPDGHVVVRGRVRLEESRGSGDDSAANDVRLDCSNGTELVPPNEGYWGSWQPEVSCPSGTAVCGVAVRFEDPFDGDDTAMNGMRLTCCKR